MDCVKCGNEIPSKRLELLPNTKTCVKCSDVQKVVGRITTVGEGDHTYNDLDIIPHHIAIKLNNA